MPELEWVYTLPNGYTLPLGYIFALALMVLASALTMGYFRYKKWL
jgi:magnesium transporter